MLQKFDLLESLHKINSSAVKLPDTAIDAYHQRTTACNYSRSKVNYGKIPAVSSSYAYIKYRLAVIIM